MTRHQIRVSGEALRTWRTAAGVQELNDTQAVDCALRVAAEVARREQAAEAHGMRRFAAWIADGHAAPQALAAGDVEVTVSGSEIRARIGDAHFVIASNTGGMAPTMTDKEQGWHDAFDIVLDQFRDFAWKKGLAQEREQAAADMEKLVKYEGREKSQDYKRAMADVVRPFFKMLKSEPSSGN